MANERLSFGFDAGVESAVLGHMNADHAADGLVMVRGLTDAADATAVEAIAVGQEGMRFRVTRDAGDCERTIAWDRPIRERADIRASVVALHASAFARLAAEARLEA